MNKAAEANPNGRHRQGTSRSFAGLLKWANTRERPSPDVPGHREGYRRLCR